MRRETARAERALEVRKAARGWRRAGTIDDATLAAIDAAYVDDRARARGFFRVLFFGFTLFAVFAVFGLIVAVGFDSGSAIGAFSIVYGLLLVGLTEVQTGPWRRDRGGTEEATGVAAVLCLAFGAVWFFYEGVEVSNSAALTLIFGTCAVLCAAAAWRWGLALFAGVAVFFAFLVLGRWPSGRLLWVISGAAFFVPLLRGHISPRLAPSHRRACAVALLVVVGAVYAAVSIYPLDHGIVEGIGGGETGFWRLLDGGASGAPDPAGLPWTPLRIASALATAALPLALIVAGVRRRRRLLLHAGAGVAVLSLLTVRAYAHLAPVWFLLAAAGAASMGLALVLRRWLDAAPGRERGGFTAEPLFENPERRSDVAVAATLTALSPAARVLPRHDSGGFDGKGGASGGAGAGGEF